MGQWTRENLLKQLALTPAAFAAALDRLGKDGFQRPPSPAEWSAFDILQHVRASDYILASRVWNALVRADGIYPALDEAVYLDLLRRAALSPGDAVAAFTVRRRELVSLLNDLSPEERATVIITDFGAAGLEERCVGMLEHEREHIRQLRAIHPAE